jgi:hypothetical protein
MKTKERIRSRIQQIGALSGQIRLFIEGDKSWGFSHFVAVNRSGIH